MNNMMILLLLLKDAADGRRERMTDRSVKVKRRVLHVCNKRVGGERKNNNNLLSYRPNTRVYDGERKRGGAIHIS